MRRRGSIRKKGDDPLLAKSDSRAHGLCRGLDSTVFNTAGVHITKQKQHLLKHNLGHTLEVCVSTLQRRAFFHSHNKMRLGVNHTILERFVLEMLVNDGTRQPLI